MAYLAFLLLGVYFMFKVPISLLPDIDIPEITVRVSYPSKSAQELEQSVVKELRTQLLQVNGIEDIVSEARDAEAIIRIKFDYGANIDLVFVEVNEKVDMAMASLPRDVARPRVIKASATDLPVFNINIAYADSSAPPERMLELSQLVSKVIRKRVEQLPDVALADLTGALQPEIIIQPNHGKMHALGISTQQIAAAIQQSMLQMASIRYSEGQLVFNVQLEQKISQPADIGQIPVEISGRVFKLNELATIGLRPAQQRGSYMHNGKPTLCVPVIKSTNARMGNLKESVSKLMYQLRAEYPMLELSLTNDQTQILDMSILNLRNSLILGIALAIGVMFLFIGDYRSPVLMGITIPVSLIVGMIFFHLIGISINIVSLSGMILGAGMMIDNAVVVIDNITQWRIRGETLEDAVVKGTNEVITPLLSSMLTTCAVFVPLIFISGTAGAMFFDQAVAIAIGLSASYMVSLTLMPTLYFVIHSKNSQKWYDRPSLLSLERPHNIAHHAVFNNKRKSLLLTALLLGITPIVLTQMERRQMPKLTQTAIIANISWGSNINLQENERRCQQLLNAVRNHTSQTSCFIGRQQLLLMRNLDMDESDASLYFTTTASSTVDDIQHHIAEWMSSHYPQCGLNFGYPESAFDRIFPPASADLTVNVASSGGGIVPSVPQIDSIKQLIASKYPQLQTESVPLRTQMQLEINSSALVLNGVSTNAILQSLEVALGTNRVGNLTYEQQVMPIVFADTSNSIRNAIETLYVKNSENSDIPLKSLVTIKQHSNFRGIFGNNTSTFVPLNINGKQDDIAHLHNDLIVADMGNRALSLTYSGEYISSQKQTYEMLGVLLVSVLLLYFILATQFESAIQPIVVLLELPLDIGIGFLALWITGGTINLMSLIGMVVMGGIIINDSILKIDIINRLRKQGVPLMEAINEGGRRRLKAIVMTGLTTTLALVPILFGLDVGSELEQPMAILIMAGMIVGTPISLYIIPLIYWVIYRKADAKAENSQ